MSVTASQLLALVQVQGAQQAERDLIGVGAASDSAGARLKNLVAGGVLLAGAALVGIGAKSIKMAGDWQSSTETLVTGAGEMQSSLDMVRQGMLKTATDTGTSTDQLVKGMFEIESSGQHGARGLTTLTDAAEGAKVGAASLADVANGVTTEMTDYASSNLTAAQATNTLITATSEGKTHLGDLSTAMATILPTSAAVHVSLDDTAGAMATMTGEGTNAAAAATYLRQLLIALEAPASKGASALKSIGLTAGEVSSEMRVSLPGALKMIMDHLAETYKVGSPQYVEALKNIAGGSRQMQGILELTGTHLKTFGDNVAGITDAVNKGGTSIIGWNKVQGDFNQKVDRAREVVEVLGIKIGTTLLPVVGKLLDFATPVVQSFSDWLSKADPLAGALDQVGSAFQQVFEPVQKVQEVTKPLLDTFDRATALLPKTAVAAKPLLDTFDRATAVIKNTTDSVNPLVSIFKEWKPVIEDVFKDVKILAGDVGTFASGIVSATDKSGLLQTDLQFLHDILPAVGTFLVNVGGDINANLLPPLESLITNVLRAEAGFVNWADKSGYAKAALSVLEGSIQLTTQILGPLIQAVSSVVGWLGGGGAGTDTLVFALSAAATAFTLLKIADTATQFGNFVSKLQEGDGVITNLALSVKGKLAKAFDDFMANQAPHLKASMDSVKASAEEAAVAEEEVAAAPADTSAAGWFAKLETELGGVEEQAAATGVAVDSVGTGAETTMAEGVAVGAAESEASLAGVGAAADAAKTQVASVGTTAETSAATGSTAIAGLSGGVVGLAIAIAFMVSEWGYANTASKSFTDQFKSGDWLSGLASIAALATPGGMLGNLAYDFHRLTVEFGLTKDSSQDMSKQTTANIQNMAVNSIAPVNKMKNTIVDDATTMAKQVYAQTSYMSAKALTNFQQLNGDLTDQMQSMDANIIGYWNAVSDYVENNPITGTVSWRSVGGPVTPGGPVGGTTHHFAAGTDYAPGGMALVGERGAELVLGPQVGYLPQGSRVIPNDQLSHGGSGWGGGGKVTVEIPVVIDGKKFASVTVDDLMELAARKTRQAHGRKVF